MKGNMAWITAWYMIGLLWISLEGSMAQTITTAPVNTAGRTGEVSRLNCTADAPGKAVAWQEFTAGAPGVRIFTSPDKYGDGMEEKYTVVTGSVGQYDLEIKNVQFGLAGLYNCFLPIDDINSFAEFVAVSAATCSRAPVLPTYIEGAMVTLRCEVEYQGYKTPTIEWYTPQGMLPAEIQDVPESNHMKVSATANITTGAHYDNTAIECWVRFQRGQEVEAAPTYTDVCSQTFFVTHAVQDIKIAPDPSDFPDGVILLAVGEQLNCSASGRPAPFYYWFEGQINIGEGQHLEITDALTGIHHVRCEASNIVQGNPKMVSADVTFSASSTGEVPITSGGTPGWVIAVSVVVPLLLIAFVLLGLFMYKRKQKKPRHYGSSTDYPSRGVDGPALTDLPPGYSAPNPAPKPRPGSGTGSAQVGGPKPYPAPIPVQYQNKGRDSPGYGDLGIRHFGASGTGVDARVSTVHGGNPGYQSSQESLPSLKYM